MYGVSLFEGSFALSMSLPYSVPSWTVGLFAQHYPAGSGYPRFQIGFFFPSVLGDVKD